MDSNDTEEEEHHVEEDEDEDVEDDDYECPEYKGTWEQDKRKKNRAVWVTCTCLKWLHQKCTIQSPEDEDINNIDTYFCSDCIND